MLAADEVISAFSCFRVPELTAFSLTDGIPCNDDVPTTGESLAKHLIVNFPFGRVTGWYQHCRDVY